MLPIVLLVIALLSNVLVAAPPAPAADAAAPAGPPGVLVMRVVGPADRYGQPGDAVAIPLELQYAGVEPIDVTLRAHGLADAHVEPPSVQVAHDAVRVTLWIQLGSDECLQREDVIVLARALQGGVEAAAARASATAACDPAAGSAPAHHACELTRSASLAARVVPCIRSAT